MDSYDQLLTHIKETYEDMDIDWDEYRYKYRDVSDEYKRIFKHDRLDQLHPNEFEIFFKMANKARKGNMKYRKAMIDFSNTKEQIKVLFNENIDFKKRLDIVISIKNGIKGMQKAGPTILLHLEDPEKNGIWSQSTQDTLDHFGLFPNDYRTSWVNYFAMNEILIKLSEDLDVGLWEMDHIMKYACVRLK